MIYTRRVELSNLSLYSATPPQDMLGANGEEAGRLTLGELNQP